MPAQFTGPLPEPSSQSHQQQRVVPSATTSTHAASASTAYQVSAGAQHQRKRSAAALPSPASFSASGGGFAQQQLEGNGSRVLTGTNRSTGARDTSGQVIFDERDEIEMVSPMLSRRGRSCGMGGIVGRKGAFRMVHAIFPMGYRGRGSGVTIPMPTSRYGLDALPKRL